MVDMSNTKVKGTIQYQSTRKVKLKNIEKQRGKKGEDKRDQRIMENCDS